MIELTTDVDFIVRCITHPYVWGNISDDGAPPMDLYFPPVNESVLWIRAGEYGVFALHKHNYVTYEAHTILLPHAKGLAVNIGVDALKWVFENTPAKRVVTNVPSFNHLALRLALRVGFKKIGINERSFCKNGVLYDQTFLGISKGDI